MEHFRILVIDDEPTILAVMKRMLSEHTVVTCLGGQLAIELAEVDHLFDLVICDVMMPEVSELDVYRYLSKNIPDLAARLVFATGGVRGGRIEEFLENFPNPVLPKPYPAGFTERIREIVASFGGAVWSPST